MHADDKQLFIKRRAIENKLDPVGSRIMWSRHAIGELVNDSLLREEVERALEQCEVIEDYSSTHRPLPDCLVLAWLADGSPVHAVVAIDEQGARIFVITVYLPSEARWHNDWRTRR